MACTSPLPLPYSMGGPGIFQKIAKNGGTNFNLLQGEVREDYIFSYIWQGGVVTIFSKGCTPSACHVISIQPISQGQTKDTCFI